MKVEGMREIQSIFPLKPVSRNEVGSSDKQPANEVGKQGVTEEEQRENMTVEKAVELINKTMESYNTELQFTLHKDSGEYMVKIINSKDHSVVREIPPERVLDMVAHFKKLLGIVVDKFI
ncbi:MAG: flagellar protein FlaG [Bacillota bacterium]